MRPPRGTVTLTNEGTNDERKQTTDTAGDYRFSGILAGTYRVSVELAGFKGRITRGITVNMSEVKRVDATLEVGDVTTSVTVEVAVWRTSRPKPRPCRT